ncbi:cytochrome c oxidase assembly protein COX20, mitochondrial [Onthophagus taurus]|uniref:cytochrome c oxidase assembly protein COX20, mitochondrial n=1 Tax=Onthophagus taurus TaxID=166361 RepID=UPI000C203539|nr:cytochrome c oxidase protein 20 homolog [Onthophagus taurus]
MSEDKAIILFGQDITKIPCFRNSFLYGISGGLGCGLMYFMFTSKPLMASHCAVASFGVITISYWAHCRYNYSKARFEMLRLQKLLQQHAMYEGTEAEKELDKKLINSNPVDI